MSQSVDPFFLVGSVRSGTTLLRLLLGHHPNICRCEEFDFSVNALGNGPDRPSLTQIHESLEMDRGFRQSGYTIDPSLGQEELMRGFLETLREEEGCPVVGAVVHSSFTTLNEIWPDARYIFLRRDPRDVSRSIVQMGWAGNTWHGMRRWIHAEREWSELVEHVPAERRMEIRFEELLDDSVGVLTRICEFLGLEYDPEMLEIERDTTYQRPRKGASASWRANAKESDVRLAEAAAGGLLSAAGYEPSGGAVRAPSLAHRVVLGMQDRAYRVRFAIRRFGPKLWMTGVVSRRLPFPRWRKDVELRAQEIMNQHVK